MLLTLFNKFIMFLSDHFELIIYINGSLVLLYLSIFIAIKMREVSLRKAIYSTMQGVLYVAVIWGQVVLFGFLGYLYWKNYERPAPELRMTAKVEATTHWVKSNVTVYYVDENTLRSIKVNGKDSGEVFKSDSPINEYHFSPDGTHIIIVTKNDLFLVNIATNESRRIDTLKRLNGARQDDEGDAIRGSINDIQWSPDSQRFSYEIARWSKFGTQDNVYIYSINDQSKRSIKSPTRRISSLYWGMQGKNLYYLHHEAQDTTLSPSSFEVKIFRIPLATLVPEYVSQISYEKASVPIENLELRGIYLFLGGAKLSFDIDHENDHFISEKGSSVGIDDDDYLYLANKRWFRRRLFKIPRIKSAVTDLARYQYRGGDLIIDHIRWIPGGRYVIMEHKHWGVLILEPSSGKFGILVEANGRAFGWYQAIDA